MNMGKEKGHSIYSPSTSFWDVALESAAFGLVGFYLALSSVTYFCGLIFCLMGWPVFLSYQLFGLRFPTMEFAGCWVQPGGKAEGMN